MKTNWPGVLCFLGFLIGVGIDIYVPIPIDLIKIMIAILTALLLFASIFFFYPNLCASKGLSVWTPDDSDDEWQITDVPDHDDRFK